MNLRPSQFGYTACLGPCALMLALILLGTAPLAGARQSQSEDGGSSNKTAAKNTSLSTSSSTTARKSTAHPSGSGKHSSHRKKTVRVRGQQKIDAERAQAIQQALIREHYLTGGPTGTWNTESEEAMRRYQSDHGWQTKEVPDSRALISLGLGPSRDHLLNPESAMTTGPADTRASSSSPTSSSASPVSHPADPGAINKNGSSPAVQPAASTDTRPATPSGQDSQHPQ